MIADFTSINAINSYHKSGCESNSHPLQGVREFGLSSDYATFY